MDYQPTTRKELWGFIAAYFDVRLPWKVFTPGHSSPFDFVADQFFNRPQAGAVWANRSGGKTLAASIITALKYRFHSLSIARLQGRILAGSADQGDNMYRYWADWCDKVNPDRVRNLLKRDTALDNGNLSILTASQRSVRGPKIQWLLRDEVDEIDPALWEASTGMMASRSNLAARTVDLSTWHRVDGPMAHLVDNADARGIKLYKWNIWEVIAPCPQERHDNGAGCGSCPLGFACLAKAREIDPDARVGIASRQACGIFQIDDAILMAKQWSRASWDAEAECKRPNPEGLVYSDFDPVANVVAQAPAGLEIYRAIDFGWGTFVCLWIGFDRKSNTVYVLDTYKAEHGTLATHAEAMKANRLKATATYGDPAGRNKSDQTGRSAIDELSAHGVVCSYSMDTRWREVKNGIDLIRGYINPASGNRRLFIVDSEANRRTILRDIQGYARRKVNDQYIDEPVKPQPADHTMDALRYFFINVLTGQKAGQHRISV